MLPGVEPCGPLSPGYVPFLCVGCDNMSAMVVLLKGTAEKMAALQRASVPPPPVPLPAVPSPAVFDEDGEPGA